MAEQANEEQAQFQIQRIYVKDVSFEAPRTPDVFRQDWEPEVKLDINQKAERVEDTIYEVCVKVNVDVQNGGGTAFMVEIEQAGLFYVEGIEDVQLQHVLQGVCPNILFPYARELVTDLVSRGTFPQFMLQHINFEAAFMEELQRQQEEAAKQH